MKTSQISRGDAKELLEPSVNRVARFFVRVLIPWLEIRRLTLRINEITVSPQKEKERDAEAYKLLEEFKKTLEMRKAEGRKEASIEHDRALTELVKTVDGEFNELKDTIVKQQSNHNDQIDQLKATHKRELAELKTKYSRSAERSQSLPKDLIEHMLPKITLVQNSLDILIESDIRYKLLEKLKTLNDQPNNSEAKRFRGTKWMEIKSNWRERMYYRKSGDDGCYLVLLGDKKSQPRDKEWMNRN